LTTAAPSEPHIDGQDEAVLGKAEFTSRLRTRRSAIEAHHLAAHGRASELRVGQLRPVEGDGAGRVARFAISFDTRPGRWSYDTTTYGIFS
jgi:hypothetical protein